MLDTGALASVGLQPSPTLVWPCGCRSMRSRLWQLVSGTPAGRSPAGVDRQRAFAPLRASTRRKFQTLGWEVRADDDSTVRQLRTDLIRTLGQFEDPAVLAEARRRFEASLTDPAALPAELRRTVLGVVARGADAGTWDRLHAMARGEVSAMLRDQYYGLLASAADLLAVNEVPAW